MDINSVCHILRATATVTGGKKFLVLGSQAILGYYLDRGYDFSFDDSSELDIAPIPDNEMVSTLIDGTLGEMSPFHETFGYYAHGNDLSTGIFPDGWDQRLLEQSYYIENISGEKEKISIFFPSSEDLALSKYCAAREKDFIFIEKLWREELLDPEKMLFLIDFLPEQRLKEKKEYVKLKVSIDVKRFFPKFEKTQIEDVQPGTSS